MNYIIKDYNYISGPLGQVLAVVGSFLTVSAVIRVRIS